MRIKFFPVCSNLASIWKFFFRNAGFPLLGCSVKFKRTTNYQETNLARAQIRTNVPAHFSSFRDVFPERYFHFYLQTEGSEPAVSPRNSFFCKRQCRVPLEHVANTFNDHQLSNVASISSSGRRKSGAIGNILSRELWSTSCASKIMETICNFSNNTLRRYDQK